MRNSGKGTPSGASPRQQQVLQFGVVAIGALLAFAETRGDFYVGALMFALVPFASLALLLLWYLDARQIGGFGRVRSEAAETTDDAAASREADSKLMNRFAALLGTTFLVTSLVGLILGFHELDSGAHPPPNAASLGRMDR